MSEVEIDRVLEALQALLLATGKTSWTEAELRALLLLAKQVLQPTLPKGRRGRPKQKAPAGQNVPELVKQASEKLGGLKPLARELGVDPNTIRRYRNGRNPEESVVKKLRDLLS
jgi:ribosome-binding protein aMBF1 (putative translation factor)